MTPPPFGEKLGTIGFLKGNMKLDSGVSHFTLGIFLFGNLPQGGGVGPGGNIPLNRLFPTFAEWGVISFYLVPKLGGGVGVI